MLKLKIKECANILGRQDNDAVLKFYTIFFFKNPRKRATWQNLFSLAKKHKRIFDIVSQFRSRQGNLLSFHLTNLICKSKKYKIKVLSIKYAIFIQIYSLSPI